MTSVWDCESEWLNEWLRLWESEGVTQLVSKWMSDQQNNEYNGPYVILQLLAERLNMPGDVVNQICIQTLWELLAYTFVYTTETQPIILLQTK